MKKERRGLAFKMSLEFLNLAFDLIKKKKYRLIPKDTQIYAIRSEDMTWNGYTIIMTSKEFPIVAEGSECSLGTMDVDKEKGIMKLRELE